MKKLKKHTLRAERNMVCALCAAVFLVFAGAALAGLACGALPRRRGSDGHCGVRAPVHGDFVGQLDKIRQALLRVGGLPRLPHGNHRRGTNRDLLRRFSRKGGGVLARGRPRSLPCPSGTRASSGPERSDAAKNIKARTLGDAQTVSYPAVCPADLAALQNKKCVLLRKTYAENRAVFDYCGVFAAQQPLIADE